MAVFNSFSNLGDAFFRGYVIDFARHLQELTIKAIPKDCRCVKCLGYKVTDTPNELRCKICQGTGRIFFPMREFE